MVSTLPHAGVVANRGRGKIRNKAIVIEVDDPRATLELIERALQQR